MIEAELPEGILFTGILLGRVAGFLYLLDIHRNAQRWIRFFPDLGISPVFILGSAVDHRIEGLVNLAAFKDIQCLLVHLPADGVGVVTGSCDQKEKRLLSRIAAAFGHDII